MYNFLIRFFAIFIFNKQQRKIFKKKFLKLNKFQKLEQELKIHLDHRFNCFINSFYKPQDIICNDLNLQLVQKANNLLLREFKRICNKNNIEYWLDWGTLLGAVRHGGFIPWDDDIDVSMTRDNIEIFTKAVEKESEFIMTEWLHLNSSLDQCRVRKFCFNDPNIHCYIDIFPYDFCYCDDPSKFYEDYLKEKSKMDNELRRLNMPQYSFCPCNNENDLKKIDKIFDKYINKYSGLKDGSFLLYGIESPYNVAKKIIKKSDVFPLSSIEFNNIEYLAPNNIFQYLSICYGSYMKIPVDVGVPKHKAYKKEEIKKIFELLTSRGEI